MSVRVGGEEGGGDKSLYTGTFDRFVNCANVNVRFLSCADFYALPNSLHNNPGGLVDFDTDKQTFSDILTGTTPL